MELDHPPFETIDSSGRPAGASVERAEAPGKYLCRPIRIEDIPLPASFRRSNTAGPNSSFRRWLKPRAVGVHRLLRAVFSYRAGPARRKGFHRVFRGGPPPFRPCLAAPPKNCWRVRISGRRGSSRSTRDPPRCSRSSRAEPKRFSTIRWPSTRVGNATRKNPRDPRFRPQGGYRHRHPQG